MPITPYHFGPGLLLKGMGPGAVSFSAFVLANIIIDAEVAVNLWTGHRPLHATLHTYAAALAAGLLAGLVVIGAGRLLGRQERAEWAARPALVGGLLGAASQPLLDSVMHADVRPFWPLSASNPALHVVDVGTLHLLCVVAGVVGGGALALRRWRRAPRRSDAER